MNITVYTITFNESLIMQFMIDHYRKRFPENPELESPFS